MLDVIDNHAEELAALAHYYGVARLELPGSANTDAFDPSRSDLDFLADFVDRPAALPTPTSACLMIYRNFSAAR